MGLQAAWLDDDRLGAMLEGLAAHQVAIWRTIIGNAVREFKPDLAWLHSDTTSVYFEGRYEDDAGAPKSAKHAPVLVKGYNKDGKPQNVQFVLSLITSKRVPWSRLCARPRPGVTSAAPCTGPPKIRPGSCTGTAAPRSAA